MVKVIALLPRRADLSREEFERYARETHSPLVARFPGLRRLVRNFVLVAPPDPAATYDAVFEIWFDDLAAMEAAFASPQGQAEIADGPNFLDMERFRLLVVQEEEVPPARDATGDDEG